MSGGGRPFNGWDGHLPSDPIERKILDAIDGFEDDDGNKLGTDFLNPEGHLDHSGAEVSERIIYAPRQANTGPKGVREDAKRHKAMMALQRQMEKVHQEEARRAAAMTCAPVDPTKNGSDDDEDEEDEEFQRYRLQRLQQMQQEAAASAVMPTFGEVEDADIHDFCEKVDHPGSAQTFVVVCLQEEYIASCARLNYRLEELAAKYDQVRFVRVVASEVKPDLDPATLPQLVFYQDGKYLGELARVGRDEGEEFATKDLEHAIMAAGVRLTAASAMRAADAAALQRLRELGVSGASAAKARRSDSDESDEEEVQ